MSDFRPYPYQVQVSTCLLSGKSVILQAPTGAGKTYAALMPFIHAQRPDADVTFPRKCLYVVPMRVLAHQFIEKYKDYSEKYKRVFGREIRCSILTGDQPDDQKLESDVIFCTVDQFLSSYLTMPYSLSKRLANLNAGAITGSYVVLDEFHLLDPESTLPSVWYAVKQLSRIAPVLLMTATFSQSMIDSLASELKAEPIVVSQTEAQEIESRGQADRNRQRIWTSSGSPLTARAVIDAHKTRSLVLCNTVRRAQSIFREIKTIVEAENLPVKVLLLHSRFLPDDRRRIEDDLRHYFGKDKGCDPTGSYIAVATQTIEVGVDITSEVLHTELAPASALIQRAGRCARYPGEQGRVIVYPVEEYRPYASSSDSVGWGREMTAAQTWLQAHSGEAFDFSKEQEFVNAVATTRDLKVLEGLFAGQAARKVAIMRVLKGVQEPADSYLLVRNVESCRVLIHPEPDQLLESPRSASGFNLHPTTLMGCFKSWQEKANELELDWTVKMLFEDSRDLNEDNRSECRWIPVTDSKLLRTAQVVVVNPSLAGYDPAEGFLPDIGNTSFLSEIIESTTAHSGERHAYTLESYEEHIQRVLTAFEQIALSEIEYPAKALEKAAGWKPGSVLKAAHLVCLFHDVGKLRKDWQAWARAHQKAIGRPVPQSFVAAHTDTGIQDANLLAAAREAARRYPKPHHAAEGALSVAPILFNTLAAKELAQAALTAITRHHTPFASDCQEYMLEPQAPKHIAATLSCLPGPMAKEIIPDQVKTVLRTSLSLQELLVNPEHTYPWMAYLLLARALRRADQIGTANATK
ncbi:MAG: CRISPR-associated helicase Cas3' [Chloroflexi bacterium]|nr:CRISPR-associated helicase Cas3' [Chloroflexota bacterium]